MTVQFTNHPSRPLMAPSLPTPRLWRSCNNPANTTASSSCMTLSRPAPTSRRTWSLTDGMRTRMVSTDTILSWRRSKLFGLQKSKRYPCHVPGVFMVNREMTKRLFHRPVKGFATDLAQAAIDGRARAPMSTRIAVGRMVTCATTVTDAQQRDMTSLVYDTRQILGEYLYVCGEWEVEALFRLILVSRMS